MNAVNRFFKFPFFIQLIWLLCLIGLLTNAVLLMRDVTSNAILWRLHVGFFILYAGQLGFILVREKYVALLALLQGIMALLTTADFTFSPLLQIAGRLYYWVCEPTVEMMSTYQYVFVALASSLQLASVMYLWGYFNRKGAR